jgi:hypothetical protein
MMVLIARVSDRLGRWYHQIDFVKWEEIYIVKFKISLDVLDLQN